MTASIFLSYASEDREAARTIGEALSGFGLDVWLDQSELGGGDAWDQKIRRQIRECDFFMPIVSARTESRHEGYFRREWRIAVERTLDMADDHLFLLPVVIDDTNETRARVPEKFLTVQWLKLPGGKPTAALEALCRRIAAGPIVEPAANKAPLPPRANTGVRGYPPFPIVEPGARFAYVVKVIGWALHSAWLAFRRLPRWIRIVTYLWLITVGLAQCHEHPEPKKSTSSDVKSLQRLVDQYRDNGNPADMAKLGEQIAREFSDDDAQRSGPNPLLAVPFAAPADDAAGRKLANAAFGQIYARLARSRRGHVTLNKETAGSSKLALAAAKASRSSYVLYGNVEPQDSGDALTVTIANVADGSVIWSKAYPIATAEPAQIAVEVDEKIPKPEDD